MISNLRDKLKAITSNNHIKTSTDDIDNKVDISSNRGNLGGYVIDSQWGQHVCKKAYIP